VNNEQRAAFEAWVHRFSQRLNLDRFDDSVDFHAGYYKNWFVQYQWEAWQAAIEHATKVSLPCAYCSKPEFKGWCDGKCPYCGVKEVVDVYN